MKIQGKVAIVTGSGSTAGIGRSTAVMLAEKGASAVLVNHSSSSSRDKALDVTREVEARGAKALLYQADVSHDHECRAMVQAAVAEFGRLDILINNAATTSRVHYEDLEALTDSVWDAALNVNLKGTFYCIRAAAIHLAQHGDGAVVNVSSIAGIRAVGASSIAYAAAKAGVINLTMFLARALAPSVRVNCVTPGFVEGQWMRASLGEERYLEALKRTAARIPRGRVAKPEDVAEAILYLVSSDFVTGHNLICDGGYLIRD